MFPTTVWTRIHAAGDRDEPALSDFAERYRPAVHGYLVWRGLPRERADDLCHDVFVRVLRSDLLQRADPARGRFRTLLRTVADRVLIDAYRKRKEKPAPDLEPAAAERGFDHAWTLAITERALESLRAEKGSAYDVIVKHLAGEPQPRNRLWHARRKLSERIRGELAETCATPADLEAELAHLAPYLRPPSGKT